MNHEETLQEERFGFERLVVYQKALAYFKLTSRYYVRPPKVAETAMDDLRRAVESVLKNLPEGAGRENGSKDQVRFYRFANGSAQEAASCHNILSIYGVWPDHVYRRGRSLLLEVCRILTAMSR